MRASVSASNNESSKHRRLPVCVPKRKSVNSIKGCAFFGHSRPGSPSAGPIGKFLSKIEDISCLLPRGDSFLDTYGRRTGVQAFYIKSARIGIDRGRLDRVYADDGPAAPRTPSAPFHYVSA